MSQKTGLLYEFGPFSLDVSEHRLLRSQEVVSLSPKVFETLLVLVEHSGHVLEKDELMKALWPDSFVEESSLTQNISLLRKALSEDGERQFIETVPKHGYRFVAPVKVMEVGGGDAGGEAASRQRPEVRVAVADEGRVEEVAREKHRSPDGPPAAFPPAPSESHARRPRRNLALLCGVALLLSAVVIGGAYFWKAKTPAREETSGLDARGRVRSLAVLPFKPLGGDSQDEFLGLGMADALIIKLSDFEQLNVRPTSAVIKYAGREYDAQSVGKRLGVDAVLDGTVQHAGERVRVTILMLSLPDGKTIWSGKFDERFTDIFALQDSISEKVANVLQLQLAVGRRPRMNRRFTEDVEAYRYYTMGLYFWNKRTKEDLTKAIDYFRKATETDPGYALAYAMLADAYCLTSYYDYSILPPGEISKRAKDAAARALELDDMLSEAHTAAGMIKGSYEQDNEGARQSYRRAIELNPNSAIARFRYASALLSALECAEAIREMRRAQELDPLSPTISATLAACLIYTARYDEAIKYSKLALEVEPQFGWARVNLGEAYEWRGAYEEAVNEYTKLTEQQGFRLYGKVGLASVRARSGRRAEAQRLLAEIKEQLKGEEAFPDLPFQIALLHVELGENDEASAWLERAIESGGVRLYQLRYTRLLDPLKNDPRYEQVLRRYERTRLLLPQLMKHSLP